MHPTDVDRAALETQVKQSSGRSRERSVSLTREAINQEARTVEFALSSEEPYDRWWGREVLSHDRSAVRLGRLSGGRHPLLMDHNTRDQVVRQWGNGAHPAEFGYNTLGERVTMKTFRGGSGFSGSSRSPS